MKRVWDFLNGRKVLLGLTAGAAYLFLISLGLIDRNDATEVIILGWLGIGLGHKAIKE